ncbi:MAG: hypothetical protein WBF44_02010 [Pseudolabrys sp.]|jgi:hypothetical protein
MKKLLTNLAALTVIATPALAQSFDPDNGTGNIVRSVGSKTDSSTERQNYSPS